MKKMKIALDFDLTLSEKDVQEIFIYLKEKYSIDLYIVTGRWIEKNKMNNDDLYQVARKFEIKEDKIFFTNNELKIDILIRNNFDLFLDNDFVEVDFFNRETKSDKGIFLDRKNNEWKKQVENKVEKFFDKLNFS